MLQSENIYINGVFYRRTFSNENFYIQRQDGKNFIDCLDDIGHLSNTYIETAIQIPVSYSSNTNGSDLPLFTGQYFDFVPNNLTWLKANNPSNNGAIYTSAYNELVKCLNPLNNTYGIKVVDVNNMNSTTDYSTYWKVDQDKMTFTTPSKTGLIVNLQGNKRVLVDKKEATTADTSWYNLYSDGWLEQGDYHVRVAASDTVELIKPYKNTNYSIITQLGHTAVSTDGRPPLIQVASTTTTNFVFNEYTAYNGCFWRAEGYTNIPDSSEYTENVNLYFKVGNAVPEQQIINVSNFAREVESKVTSKQAANSSVPGSKYVQFTADVTDTTYTAPDDGFWYVDATSSAVGGYVDLILLQSHNMGTRETAYAKTQQLRAWIPASKNSTLQLSYANATINDFTFICCNTNE